MTAAISQIELFGKFDESVVTQSNVFFIKKITQPNVLGVNKTSFSSIVLPLSLAYFDFGCSSVPLTLILQE